MGRTVSHSAAAINCIERLIERIKPSIVSKNVFFIGLILAASGLVSPPIALAGGLIYGFSFHSSIPC